MTLTLGGHNSAPPEPLGTKKYVEPLRVNNIDDHYCEDCDKSFGSNFTLKQHIEKTHEKKKPSCDIYTWCQLGSPPFWKIALHHPWLSSYD